MSVLKKKTKKTKKEEIVEEVVTEPIVTEEVPTEETEIVDEDIQTTFNDDQEGLFEDVVFIENEEEIVAADAEREDNYCQTLLKEPLNPEIIIKTIFVQAMVVGILV